MPNTDTDNNCARCNDYPCSCLDKTPERKLEDLVDQLGLPAVLACLSSVCYAKANHVVENWQDETLAKDWEEAARLVEVTETATDRLFPRR